MKKTADQALDELMHGDTESLRQSILEEAVLMGVTDQTYNNIRGVYDHAQLVNWWVSYFRWNEHNQTWWFRQTGKQETND